MIKPVNEAFHLTESDRTSFSRNGFVKLSGFLTPELIVYLREKISREMKVLDESQVGFKSIGYDLFEGDERIKNLLSDPGFGEVLVTLSNRSLFYTQGVGFELEKNKHHGFPWHIGTQSFGYQKADDYGCSIWIPLEPILNSQQGGGMSYVPEHIVSGKFMYDFVDPAIDEALQLISREGPDVLSLEEFSELRHGILNSPAMHRLLNCHRHSDDFQLGDVLFFNKYVIHASEMLDEGPIESRCAFVMRFIDQESKYDRRRAEGLEFPKQYFGHEPQSKFHIDVCSEDGDLISESPYFNDAEVRCLSR